MGKWRLIGVAAGMGVLLTASAAFAQVPPGGTFTDDNDSVFEGAIEAIAAEGITRGCNPPANTRFCPDDQVTRGQMAIFIARAYNLLETTVDFFNDDNGKVYEDAANRLAHARLTQGCAPNRYCGDDTITRGEMAAFLSRAEALPPSTTDRFADDNGHIFEGAINSVAESRITLGCNPPVNDSFCPDDSVTRGQMAGFIARALGLTPFPPPGGVDWLCNQFTSSYICSGNTDTVDPLPEIWSCNFFSPSINCSGDINKVDAFKESWACTLVSESRLRCSGNVDKADSLDEFWTCNIASSLFLCQGENNQAHSFIETWSCSLLLTTAHDCSGMVGGEEVITQWFCHIFSSSWSCSGDLFWLSPIMDTWLLPSAASLHGNRVSDVATPN